MASVFDGHFSVRVHPLSSLVAKFISFFAIDIDHFIVRMINGSDWFLPVQAHPSLDIGHTETDKLPPPPPDWNFRGKNQDIQPEDLREREVSVHFVSHSHT